MKSFKFCTLTFFVLLSFLLTSNVFAGRGGLPNEWTEINPADYGFSYINKVTGEELTPACSNCPGTPDDEFTFFVKGGKKKNKKNIVIFFNGGGACWDSMNCFIAPTYTRYQTEELTDFTDDKEGIFDQTEKSNPFKGWGIVYIPYCTGDLFWGAHDQDYLVGGTTETIKHRGFVNFQAVLKYLTENTKKPNKIFVTGSSAGSYGATMAFPFIKKAFPKSKAYLLGDAGLGVMGGTFPTEGINNWSVQTPDWIFPDGYTPDLTMDQIYKDIAAEYPKSPMAQYTTAWDSTQIFFYNVMLNINDPSTWGPTASDVAPVWYATGLGYLYNTAMDAPNYRYYIAEGMDHTILRSPKFYTESSAEDISFARWVKRMIKSPRNPRKWKSLECEECLPVSEPVPE